MNIFRKKICFKENFPCSNDSCESCLCKEPSHHPNFIQDPIVLHTIELRNYKEETNKVLNENKDGQTAENPTKPPPPFPEKYPFWGTLEDTENDNEKPRILQRLKLRNKLDENVMINLHQNFVESICGQVGCHINKSVIQELGKVNERFLEKFIGILCQTKDILKEEDKLVLLDFSLQKIGFGGIKGLHEFYLEQVVKKHDILNTNCLKLCAENMKKARQAHKGSNLTENKSGI